MIAHPRRLSRRLSSGEGDCLARDNSSVLLDDEDSSFLLGNDEEKEEEEGGGDLSDREASTSSKHSRNTAHSQSSSSSHHPMALLPRTRAVVSILILVAAVAIGTTAYVLTARSQNQAFETQYHSFCDLILASTQASSDRLIATVQSFSDTITTYTVATGALWPFVTLPDFEILGIKSNQASKALSLTFSPLVEPYDLVAWEEYSEAHQSWLDQSLVVKSLLPTSSTAVVTTPGGAMVRRLEGAPSMATRDMRRLQSSVSIPDDLWGYDSNGDPHPVDVTTGASGERRRVPYAPVWQQAPAPSNSSVINYDLLSDPGLRAVYDSARAAKRPVLSSVIDLKFLYSGSKINLLNTSESTSQGGQMVTSLVMSPLYPFIVTKEDAPQHGEILLTGDMSGLLLAVVEWSRFLTFILPFGVNGIVAVLSNSCGQTFTYQINGPDVVFLGKGDLHDTNYNTFGVTSRLMDATWPLLGLNKTATGAECMYTVQLYPSRTLQDIYLDEKPAIYAAVVVLLFAFTAAIFWLYDLLVQRRQAKVNATTKKSNAILSSLFPSTVRDRILKEAEEQAEQELQLKNQAHPTLRLNKRGSFALGNKALLRDFLDEEGGTATNQSKAETGAPEMGTSKPIADLFPETSVCFADLVGFTAWSSVREPTQVFQLLETIYHAFDKIAKKQNVFKVETIGDCYVAVTGLPEPHKDHAILMCRFAHECVKALNELTRKLETTLGPDTGELSLRVGIHSGPVTAGVLRGERSRFQLFGDTVITAGLIESTGERNRIHLSQETAELLIVSGKGHWVEERTEKIHTKKGKDLLQTYWLTYRGHSASGQSKSSGSSDEDGHTAAGEHDYALPLPAVNPFDSKTQRLVEWTTDVLSRLLKDVVASRLSRESYRAEGLPKESDHRIVRHETWTVLEEVVEIISLPEFDVRGATARVDACNMELSDKVKQQLRDYVTIIASMYRANPFHNFEHASHVTMSVVKLLSRIVAPNLTTKEIDTNGNIASTLHDHTYGITSDPLTQFAVVLSALIHDVDHLGVPNAQLVKENSSLARAYKGKSVAEQNSVDVAWNLLMDFGFKELRMAIYSNQDELNRFRQLIVNTVMATDIMDKDLKALRNARWDKAFLKEPCVQESSKDIVDRKATIVIEHLIQASDVAHTMQHWHIYRKWNERLFFEMYKAYKSGRAEKDPSEFWYKGEIGFFDFYIIPLAKKLKDCGVFGVSSDEYLNYAENNRKEWEAKGLDVVEAMVEKCRQELLGVTEHDHSTGYDFDPLFGSSLSPRKSPGRSPGKEPLANQRSTISDAVMEKTSLRPPISDCESLETVGESPGVASFTVSDSRDSQSAPSFRDTAPTSADDNFRGRPDVTRGALDISEKRFQEQLARVQPQSQPSFKIERTFL